MEPHATTALWDGPAPGPHAVGLDAGRAPGPRGRRRGLRARPRAGAGGVARTSAAASARRARRTPTSSLAAMAARAVPGRPVSSRYTRQQMFSLAGYRTPTIQRMQLAADADGHLRGIAIDVVEQTSKVKEFAEQTGVPTRSMYASPNRRTTHRLAALDVPGALLDPRAGRVPGHVRRPRSRWTSSPRRSGSTRWSCGSATTPRSTRRPASRSPAATSSSACAGRASCSAGPGATRGPASGATGAGWSGPASPPSIYPDLPAGAVDGAVRFAGGRYTVRDRRRRPRHRRLDGAAADRRRRPRRPVDDVDVLIGDTAYPVASVAGGSSGTATWGSAIVEAARAFRRKYGYDACRRRRGRGVGRRRRRARPLPDVRLRGAVRRGPGGRRHRRDPGAAAARRVRRRPDHQPADRPLAVHRRHDHGPVDGPVRGERARPPVRPRRQPRPRRVPRRGHADVGDVAGALARRARPATSTPMGSKGIGEIGIVGTAAAVSNAVWHATGSGSGTCRSPSTRCFPPFPSRSVLDLDLDADERAVAACPARQSQPHRFEHGAVGVRPPNRRPRDKLNLYQPSPRPLPGAAPRCCCHR